MPFYFSDFLNNILNTNPFTSGSTSIQTKKAFSNPNNFDDSSKGNAIGSRWVNIGSDQEYVCVDASVGNAKWRHTTLEVDDTSSGSQSTWSSLKINETKSNQLHHITITEQSNLFTLESDFAKNFGFVHCNTTSTSYTVTLPPITSKVREIRVSKNADPNPITIVAYGDDSIGVEPLVLSSGTHVFLTSNYETKQWLLS